MTTWKVPFIDYAAVYRSERDELFRRIDMALANGDVMLRSQLEDFERAFAVYQSATCAVGVNSGTDALYFALRALGIGTGHEVITVSHTMTATVGAVLRTGATPVLVDIGDDHLIDPQAVYDAVTPRTQAVLPVHLNGRLADLYALHDVLALDDGGAHIAVVSDAAQAVGARLNGMSCEELSDAACYSFYPAKVLGCYGDGGAVTTDDPQVASRVRMFRNHGKNDDGETRVLGYNSRLDNLQAVVLAMRLERLDAMIAKRNHLASQYHSWLQDIPELSLPALPDRNAPHLDVFQNYEVEAEERDKLRHVLTSASIETLLPWGGTPVHRVPAYAAGCTAGPLPRTEELFEKVLLLPMHTELTIDQVDHVCGSIRRFYGRH